jgi:hypothetical protein
MSSHRFVNAIFLPVRKPIEIKPRTRAAWLSATTAVHFGHRCSRRGFVADAEVEGAGDKARWKRRCHITGVIWTLSTTRWSSGSPDLREPLSSYHGSDYGSERALARRTGYGWIQNDAGVLRLGGSMLAGGHRNQQRC